MSSTVLTLANILYVLVAVAMIVMILLQRGAGAAAGSGFGAGASATVFGARGSANFLSKSTAILATLFFAISLGMAMYVARGGLRASPADDLGVMGQLSPTTEQIPAATAVEPPAASVSVPAQEIPAAEPAANEAASTAIEQSPEVEDSQQTPPSEGGSGE